MPGGGPEFRNGGGKLSWLSLDSLYIPLSADVESFAGNEEEVTRVGGRNGGRFAESRGHVRELLCRREANMLQGSQLGLE